MYSDKALHEKTTEQEVQVWKEKSSMCWKEGLEKFSKYSECQCHRNIIFFE